MWYYLALTCCLLFTLLNSMAFAQEVEPEMDVNFKPVLLDAKFTTREIRPGDVFGVTFRFRNDGTAPGKMNYYVFLHFEHPEKTCRNIAIHSDHPPTTPTSIWKPGEVVVDGPHAIKVPENAAEGDYYVHVGVYAQGRPGYPRFSDDYTGTLKVSSDAPPHVIVLEPLPKEEVAVRRQRLLKRITHPLVLENEHLRFELSKQTGAFALIDKSTDELWASNPSRSSFAEVALNDGKRTRSFLIDRFDKATREGNALRLVHTPRVDDKPLDIALVFKIESVDDPAGLRFSYYADEKGAWRVENIRLLDKSFWTTDADEGYFAVPHRLGVLLPTDRGLPFTNHYRAYSNSRSYSMAMLGVVKNGSALMLSWDDPYAVLEVQQSWPDLPIVAGRRMLSASLILRKSARSFTVHPLGKGGYVEIAKAYRAIAKERGYLKTWAEKLRDLPRTEKMFGAADFKPFVFSRVLPHTRWNKGDRERTNVGYTFEEAAQVAEHLRNDLAIDRAMFVLAGWIHRGYDNQHPDILPAAPECGGDKALSDCARRVKALGYLFGLHDNYQDMYKDAPSWNEDDIMKNPDGSLRGGGVWAGGQAYLTCSKRALKLAQRPQNLRKVQELFGPTIYFIDTTFAAPPLECFDPQHPLSLADDITYKAALCDYAKEVFGLFGSEEGQEWAVPHADYFEGLMSHKTRQSKDEIIVPLFELVYGDCINLYAHQGDRARADRAKYILDHILYAEMPVYHFGQHLYFKERGPYPVPVTPKAANVKQVDARRFEITYQWVVKDDLTKSYRCFVHFTNPAATRPEEIVFQDDHAFARPTNTWRKGEVIQDGPHTVETPEGWKGSFEILLGIVEGSARQPIKGLHRRGLRYSVGRIIIGDDGIKFSPPTEEDIMPDDCFSQADGGWAESFNSTDRLIKNSYEILSHLNRLTAQKEMTDHKFLTDDRSVERTVFGDNVEIIVNYGNTSYDVSADETLPPYGFTIKSPTFIAFRAAKHAGLSYKLPALFTARSLDDQPLERSSKCSIYHGTGDKHIRIGGKVFDVEKEGIVSVK